MTYEIEMRPSSQQEILALSYQYQREWRFEREKRLVQYALILFPQWQYLQKRIEWHQRPLFHRDPEKSKLAPRNPLHLPRNPNWTPKQETINSICFVTGASSNAPYFDLCVQLIESIKNTRWYNHVPIKVLDCGLTPADIEYLKNRFGCEVKDPGWDVPVNKIRRSGPTRNINNMKGIISRPYIAKHFPGFEYYFWIDADTWVQDERALDYFISFSEKQGLGGACDWPSPWDEKHFYIHSLPAHLRSTLYTKTILMAGIYCIRKDINDLYVKECEEALKHIPYQWGFDFTVLNYVFHKYIPKGTIFTDRWSHDPAIIPNGALVDENRYLLLNTNPEQYLGIIDLMSFVKRNKPVGFFRTVHTTHFDEKFIGARQDYTLHEEEMYEYCKANKCSLGNYFFRIFPTPEQLYGPMESVIL